MFPNLTRPIYWNVEYAEPFMIPLGIALVGVILYGLHLRYKRWRALGVSEVRWDRPWERTARLLKSGLGQIKVARRSFAGPMHSFIFGGFAVLFVGTVLVAIERDLGQHLLGAKPVAFFHGAFYGLCSLAMDIAGVLVVVGCLMALYRRLVLKPEYLEGRSGYLFWVVFLLVVSLTGFYVEAARIAHSAFVVEGETVIEANSSRERISSPVGYALSRVLPQSAVTPRVQHAVIWWGHAVLSFGFLLGFAFGAMRHSVTGLANLFFAPLEGSTGTLQPIPDMEEAETFGVTSIDQFTWKTLFDSDACVSCGRCEQHCPASITGKPLSPRRVVLALNKAWENATDKLLAGETIEEHEPIVETGYVTEDELFACTTCGACMNQCPVGIEHIPAIVDLRRSLVMMESKFPEEAQLTMVNLENAGNPWGLDNETRADWAQGLEVSTLDEVPDPEVLFWVGCAGSFDVRAKPTSRALVRILNAAGVKFAILGAEERCCGDPARRIGNEYLYAILAGMMVETMNEAGVKKIVTACPHCFHTILNEYPQLGGHYEVVHHTEYIRDLIAAGRIPGLEAKGEGKAVYHDSCYLGRHNDVYDAPRDLAVAAGIEVVEADRNREESFCCGAGGGRMWMEEDLGDKKINIERTEEILATGVDQVAVACPFCKTMLADGAKEKGREEVVVRDVAEILADGLSED